MSMAMILAEASNDKISLINAVELCARKIIKLGP